MSIRVKLVITYAILLLVSIAILVSMGIAITAFLINDFTSAVLEEDDLHVVVTQTIDLLAELKQAEDFTPNHLVEADYIKTLSARTDFYQGGVIVKHKNSVYNYTNLPQDQAFYDLLLNTDFEFNHKDREGEPDNMVRYLDKQYFYIHYPFRVSDQSVDYFFVFDLSETQSFKRTAGTKFFRVILVILLVIMSPILFIVTQDIIKPLRQLEQGVYEIQRGNLDFKLTTKKTNEVGRVITYFDRMRHELKKSITAQIRAEENRKELVSSISHDLKTPITSIKGYIEGIRDGVANTPEKQEKYLNVIYEKSKYMDSLIDDLFLFSKLDVNKLPFNLQDVPLKAFLTHVVEEMKVGWESDTHSLVLDMGDTDEALTVSMDDQHMKRVFVNLIQNSMKYARDNRVDIRITVSTSPEHVRICVIDQGTGIKEEDLTQIFERFYRVDASRNTQAGGTGLGLAIAKQIVEQHQGTIEAQSQVGQGTTMCILLKRNPSKEANRV